MMITLPAFLEGNGGLVDHFVLSLFPVDLEVGGRDRSRADVLHVVDLDLFSDQVGLFQPCLVVVVDVPVHHSKLG